MYARDVPLPAPRGTCAAGDVPPRAVHQCTACEREDAGGGLDERAEPQPQRHVQHEQAEHERGGTGEEGSRGGGKEERGGEGRRAGGKGSGQQGRRVEARRDQRVKIVFARPQLQLVRVYGFLSWNKQTIADPMLDICTMFLRLNAVFSFAQNPVSCPVGILRTYPR